MQSVGQKLRLARLAQTRTLEEVHSSTRIPLKTLEAIEADELNRVSSAFLYRSFVRQFAQSLAIDFAELEPLLQAAADTIPPPLIPGEGVTPAPKVAALRIGRKKNSRLIYSVSSFTLVLIACSALYAFWQTSRFRPPPSRPRPAAGSVPQTDKKGQEGMQTTAPSSEFKAGKNPLMVDGSVDLGGPDSKPRASGRESFTVELSATEPTWLSILTDGKPSFKGILERAQRKILESHRTARIKTGNAGAVNVVFNGRSLGVLGPPGQARTVLFTKNRYEVLEAPRRVAFSHFILNAELKQPLVPFLLRPGF